MEMIRRKDETVYRDSIYVDGERIRSPYFKRKADVKIWKATFLSDREKAKLHGEDFKVPVKMTIKEFATNWMEQKVKVQRTQSTYENYETIFRIHIFPAFEKVLLTDFTTSHADKLVKALHEKGHRPKGINRKSFPPPTLKIRNTFSLQELLLVFTLSPI